MPELNFQMILAAAVAILPGSDTMHTLTKKPLLKLECQMTPLAQHPTVSI